MDFYIAGDWRHELPHNTMSRVAFVPKTKHGEQTYEQKGDSTAGTLSKVAAITHTI